MHLIPQFKLPKEEKEKIIVQFSHSVVSDSLWPQEPQHPRPPCPSPTPGVQSIESVMSSNHLILCRPLLLLPSIFPSSGSFQMSQLFASVAHLEKNPLAMQETPVGSLGQEDPLAMGIGYPLQYSWASLVAQLVKNLPVMWEIWVWPLGREDPLEKGKATHSSILAWKIPRTILSIRSQRIGHDWVTEHASVHVHTRAHTHPPPTHTHTHRAWPKWVQRTGRWQSWEQQL